MFLSTFLYQEADPFALKRDDRTIHSAFSSRKVNFYFLVSKIEKATRQVAPLRCDLPR